MAAPGLCRHALRLSHRTQWLSYRQWQLSIPAQHNPIRSISITPLRRDKSTPSDASETSEKAANNSTSGSDDAPHFNDDFYASLYSGAKDSYLDATPAERKQLEAMHAAMMAELGPDSDVGRDLEALVEREADAGRQQLGPSFFHEPDRPGRTPDDFSSMEDPDREIAPDEKFVDDDVTSLAHAQLDVHREMREYSRLAAWEMPLLSNLSRPFAKPTAKTPLRWRYTTYLGVPHPAAHKVVLDFSPSALGLTLAQQAKLIKLAGPRYDPHTRRVKMSEEAFPSQAQNKRSLGAALARLVAEARDGTDTMADVPFDFRHAKRRERHVFPREWLRTPAREAQIEVAREESAARDRAAQEGEGGGRVVGVEMIEAARAREAVDAQKVVVGRVEGKKGRAGVGKPVAVGRRR